MDDSQKKIMPGCEKLTKPEEISALKDYLKQGILENEESLIIGDENPVIQTSEGPNVRKLIIDQEKKILLNTAKEKLDLNDEIVSLDIPGEINTLGDNSKVTLNIGKQSTPNKNYISELSVERNSAEIKEHLDTIKKEGKIDKLPNKLQTLVIDDKKLKTNEYREQLSVLSDKSSLSNFFSPLDIENKKTSIEPELVTLTRKKEEKPTKEVIELFDEREISITEEKSRLFDDRVTEISSDKVKIFHDREIELPEDKLELTNELEIELPDQKLKISENKTTPTNSLFEILENNVDPYQDYNVLLKTSDEDLKITALNENPDEPYERNWQGDNGNNKRAGVNSIFNPEEYGDLKTQNKIETSKSLPSNDHTTYSWDENGNFKENTEGGERTWIGDNKGDSSNSINSEKLENYSELGKSKNLIETGKGLAPNDYTTYSWGKDGLFSEINENGERTWIGDTSNAVPSNYLTQDKLDDYIKEPKFSPALPRKTKKLEDEDPVQVALAEAEQSYLGISGVDYEKFKEIKRCVSEIDDPVSKNWAKKVLTYLQATLSGTEGWRMTVDKSKIDALIAVIKSGDLGQRQDGRVTLSENIKEYFDEYHQLKDTESLESYSDKTDLAVNKNDGWIKYPKDSSSKDSNDLKESLSKNEDRSKEKEIGRRPGHYNPYTNMGAAFSGGGINANLSIDSGMRWAAEGVAEGIDSATSWLAGKMNLSGDIYSAIGKITGGSGASTKQHVIDMTLWALTQCRDLLREVASDAPHRLPGFSADGSAWNQVAQSASKLALGGGSLFDKGLSIAKSWTASGNPMNRPSYDKTTGKTTQTQWNIEGDKVVFSGDYLGLDAKTGKNYKNPDSKFSVDEAEIDITSTSRFYGIRTTLEDLCLGDPNSGSLEDLKDLLKRSPFVTTSDKVNKGTVLTLDSNHVWELRLFPYLGLLNGYCSWLPNIAEINSINYAEHGVRTMWGDWIPVNSFELQSRKMTQKTLGLFDGEISYPTSMEFTNELRLTLIDDQYKSWRRYFELCAECSIYLTKMVNYEGNCVRILNAGKNQDTKETKEYTRLESTDLLSYGDTTPIVKNTISPGMYKNLAFRCLIYVMTPQMSTIKKFDLLVTLKDFSIEYTGETDSSSSDLNLSFSVVGENPNEAIPVVKNQTAAATNEEKEGGFLKSVGNKLKGKLKNDQIKGSVPSFRK